MRTPRTTKQARSTRQSAYTLVEIMIALAVFGIVMAGLMQFSFQTTRILYDSSVRMDIDAEVRRFLQQAYEDMKTADAFYLYPDFQAGNRNSSADRVAMGGSGDFLFMVFTEPQPNVNSTVYVTKIIGYYRVPEDGTRGPIYRFQYNYPSQTVPASSSVEGLLSGIGIADNNHKKIVSSAVGTFANNCIFYNQQDACIFVSANLYSGNKVRNSTHIIRMTLAP